jgi:serine/threonine-protein kinase
VLVETVAKALSLDPNHRFESAREMAIALEQALTPASPLEIGQFVETVASDTLVERARAVARIEAAPTVEAAERHSATLPPTGRRRGPVLIGAVALIIAVSGLGALATWRHADARRVTAPEQPAAALKSEAAPEVSVVAASGAALVTPDALPVTATTTSQVQGGAAPAPGSTTRGARGASGPARARPLNCTPPYTIDASGARHWKNGC